MIIFLYGQDNFRSRQKLNELKDKFKREVDQAGDSISRIDGETADLNEINGAISSPSLFARKRMVIIENIFSNNAKTIAKELAAYFKKRKTDDNIVIFLDDVSGEKMGANPLFKFLNEQKTVQNFKPLTNSETAAWIKTEVEKNGMKIEPSAVAHLNILFQNDLWALANEIKKIEHFKKAKQGELIEGGGELKIVVADIEKLSRGKTDENIFALTDAISQKRKDLAMELLEKEIESGVAEQYLLHMIQRNFKILLKIRQALDSGYAQRQIATDLKLHPFVVQKSIGQVRNFSLDFLKKIFSHLIKIDREFKTGKTDLKTALSLLIAKI